MEEKNGKAQDKTPKLKYPKSVFFIVTNEFCERFSYYGMKTILALYLTTVLKYDSDSSTQVYHLFNMLCYFFPLVGAIIADSYFGKYKTILYLSILYACGNIVLSAASATVLGLPQRTVSLLGLLLIAIGTGGIKPCVCPFGGDQFILPEQERQLQRYFSVFYFSINAGSLISTALTPILREDVKCLGEDSCFPLAFGVPAVLMVISLVIFVAGTPLYTRRKPEGNVIVTVIKCIVRAVRNKLRRREYDIQKNHWLEYAGDKFDKKTIADVKAVLNVLYMFLPVPLFWALFDQQGSRWVFQATRMDGRFFGYTIKPDQMNVINPLLILVFIPLFEKCFYPILYKIGIRRPLQKLTFGGILAAFAFFLSALLEFRLQAGYPVLPGPGEGQLRILNTLNCSVAFKPPVMSVDTIAAMSEETILHLEAHHTEDLHFDISVSEPCASSFSPFSGGVQINEGESVSYAISNDESGQLMIYPDFDDLAKDLNGMVKIRIFLASSSKDLSEIELVQGEAAVERTSVTGNAFSKFMLLHAGSYDVIVNNRTALTDISLNPGSIVTVVVRLNKEDSTVLGYVDELVPPNSIHMLWQMPQIIVITAGEIMFSVTGLEFSFTQAPESMKSVLSAAWLLTVAFGNMIVVVISEIKFQSQAYEFLLFSALMLLDMVVFMLMAMGYRYVDVDSKSVNSDIIQTEPSKDELHQM